MGLLRLGELEVAYSMTTPDGKVTLTTTGDVASILEERYHVFQTFFELRREKIEGYIADSLAHSIQDLVNGRTSHSSPTYEAEQKIEAEFRSFLDANEMQKLAIQFTGTPISSAAARGSSNRKKRPYSKKNKARPAFVDTGLYRISFRAIVKL